MPAKYISPDERAKFERFIVKASECWLWSGDTKNGLPSFIKNDGQQVNARNFAYQAYLKELPKYTHVYNKCGNPKCIRPKHSLARIKSEITTDLKLLLELAER